MMENSEMIIFQIQTILILKLNADSCNQLSLFLFSYIPHHNGNILISFQPFTVIEPWVFESITPSQFITFTMPNPLTHRRLLHALVLRVAILDSPIATSDDESPIIAAMIVPNHRETDWNFCTESGHLQLLYDSHNVSRLILIGNNPPPNPELPSIYIRPPVIDPMEKQRLENELKPLLMALHPKVSFQNRLPETLILSYEDDVVYRVTIAKYVGPIVGEFVVEDVELEGGSDRSKILRRRLRFKRMPNLIQSQAPVIPVIGDDEATTQTDLESLRKIGNAKFEADTLVLVHPYLTMVAGVSLIASHLNERIRQGVTPRALCLGVGGGVLLSFLDTQLGFEVVGVEADKVVLTAAKQHFGFNKSGSIRVIVGDAIQVIQNFPSQKTKGETDDLKVNKNDAADGKFDVVMVDLDSSEVQNGISAPPPEFVKKPVFKAARSILDDHGVLIINVVPLNELFYTTLVKDLKDTFRMVYGIDVGNQGNFVVMATLSPTSSDDNNDNEFLKKLRSVIPGSYLGSIVEL